MNNQELQNIPFPPDQPPNRRVPNATLEQQAQLQAQFSYMLFRQHVYGTPGQFLYNLPSPPLPSQQQQQGPAQQDGMLPPFQGQQQPPGPRHQEVWPLLPPSQQQQQRPLQPGGMHPQFQQGHQQPRGPLQQYPPHASLQGYLYSQGYWSQEQYEQETEQYEQEQQDNYGEDDNHQDSRDAVIQKLRYKLSAERRKNKYLSSQVDHWKNRYLVLENMNKSSIIIPLQK